MRVLMWHGYLLSGSGSNVLTANLARTWRALGHDVLLLCQERRTSMFDFIDADGDFGDGEVSLRPPTSSPESGRCRVLRPDIDGLLPVYVYDRYEGFEVKTFLDLSDDELEAYVSSNQQALAAAIHEHDPDTIVVGHEVMGPFIAATVCGAMNRRFIVQLHGSALEFAVKPQERYLRFATEGLNAAGAVVGGSRYMIEEAARVVPGWRDRAVVVNPGCDVELFQPRPRTRSDKAAIGFVGKLIAAKGVHHLLAAVGLTTSPLHVVVVGYGGFEEGLKELLAALRAGDVARARIVATTCEEGPLEELLAFLHAGRVDEAYIQRMREVEVHFTGRLEHDPLAELLPTFDVLVAPSVIREAFGMVVAEAAACGVLPIVPAHSGIGEAGAALEDHLGAEGLFRFDPETPIDGIAGALGGLLSLDGIRRQEMEREAVAYARQNWSWEHVARRLLEL